MKCLLHLISKSLSNFWLVSLLRLELKQGCQGWRASQQEHSMVLLHCILETIIYCNFWIFIQTVKAFAFLKYSATSLSKSSTLLDPLSPLSPTGLFHSTPPTLSGKTTTRFMDLWTESAKCFLKLYVMFLAQESGLELREQRVQWARFFKYRLHLPLRSNAYSSDKM